MNVQILLLFLKYAKNSAFIRYSWKFICIKKRDTGSRKEQPDQWICLGDLVGYGPFPGECIDLVREKEMIVVKGNHDAGVTGELTLKHFRNPNRKLIEITQNELSRDQISWLQSLPFTVENSEWISVHASPIEPESWEYVQSAFRARALLNNIEQNICFIGHTHRPAIISNQLGVQQFKRDISTLLIPEALDNQEMVIIEHHVRLSILKTIPIRIFV